jgi:hypothetical protein
MAGLAPFQPDQEYCVYCHRPAAGRCAVCHALVCADCSVLKAGLIRPLALCKECAENSPRPRRVLLMWLLAAAVFLAVLVAAFLLLSPA